MLPAVLTTHSFQLNAIHKLNLGNENSEPLHGHEYKYYVTLRGEVDVASGFTISRDKVRKLVNKHITDVFHMKKLNDIVEFSSGEYLAKEIYQRLKLTDLKDYLEKITIIETTKNRFEYP